MVLDHLIVESMDTESLDYVDIESIIRFGAMALFKEDEDIIAIDNSNENPNENIEKKVDKTSTNKAIVYDDNALESLLDRTKVDTVEEAKEEGSDKKNHGFAFARVWTQENDSTLGGTATSMEEDIDKERQVLGDSSTNALDESDFWDKLLKERVARAEEQKALEYGRGMKRKKTRVNYSEFRGGRRSKEEIQKAKLAKEVELERMAEAFNKSDGQNSGSQNQDLDWQPDSKDNGEDNDDDDQDRDNATGNGDGNGDGMMNNIKDDSMVDVITDDLDQSQKSGKEGDGSKKKKKSNTKNTKKLESSSPDKKSSLSSSISSRQTKQEDTKGNEKDAIMTRKKKKKKINHMNHNHFLIMLIIHMSMLDIMEIVLEMQSTDHHANDATLKFLIYLSQQDIIVIMKVNDVIKPSVHQKAEMVLVIIIELWAIPPLLVMNLVQNLPQPVIDKITIPFILMLDIVHLTIIVMSCNMVKNHFDLILNIVFLLVLMNYILPFIQRDLILTNGMLERIMIIIHLVDMTMSPGQEFSLLRIEEMDIRIMRRIGLEIDIGIINLK